MSFTDNITRTATSGTEISYGYWFGTGWWELWVAYYEIV